MNYHVLISTDVTSHKNNKQKHMVKTRSAVNVRDITCIIEMRSCFYIARK